MGPLPVARFARVRRLAAAALAVADRSGRLRRGRPEERRPPTRRSFAGAPPPLAALHDQASELLDGGADAFKARLAKLRGYPVVVNKWASWCGPCRAEFPYFQRQVARSTAREVAFLGVDSNDNDGDAREFLSEYPVTYPSYLRTPT